jgi:MerR family copper efflux transcriptional regulator
VRLPQRLKLDGMTKSPAFSIGVLARRTGCSVPTIRYYETIDLLPPGPRTDAGRRVYDEAAVRRLGFIRRCRDFGFGIDQVRELVGLMDEPQRPCVEVREVAARHLGQLRTKLAELKALEAAMASFVGSCDTACAGGAALDCSILEDLAAPADEARLLQAPTCCSGG